MKITVLFRLALVALLCHSAVATAAPATRPTTPLAAVNTCASLAAVDLQGIGGAGSRVTSTVEGSSYGAPACTVEATLAPAIGVRVVLPLATWTQRLLQVSCGGLCGNVPAQVRPPTAACRSMPAASSSRLPTWVTRGKAATSAATRNCAPTLRTAACT